MLVEHSQGDLPGELVNCLSRFRMCQLGADADVPPDTERQIAVPNRLAAVQKPGRVKYIRIRSQPWNPVYEPEWHQLDGPARNLDAADLVCLFRQSSRHEAGRVESQRFLNDGASNSVVGMTRCEPCLPLR